MSGDNPFAQWGGERDQPNLSPSIYGALPLGQSTPVPYNLPGRYASSSTNASSSSASSGGNSQLQIMSFRFVSPARTILNSTLMGADGKKYFTIATHAIGNTVVVNEQAGGNGEAGGSIEWQRYPIVSLMDIVARQTAKQWLALSADKRYRSMTLRGQQYSWVPSTGMICLYTSGHNPSEFVARIVQGKEGSGVMVALDITAKAVQAGLLDACVLAAVLFTSGRNID